MAKFLRTKPIGSQIETIVIEAKEKLVIISPYIKISKMLFERLQEKEAKNIEVILVYGKAAISEDQRQNLHSLRNLTIYYYQELHAKCYYNEKEMVITSMNLHSYSENNNREMGILLKKDEDRDVYDEAEEEAQSIISKAKLEKKATLTTEENKLEYPHPLKFEHVGNIEKWNEKLLRSNNQH